MVEDQKYYRKIDELIKIDDRSLLIHKIGNMEDDKIKKLLYLTILDLRSRKLK